MSFLRGKGTLSILIGTALLIPFVLWALAPGVFAPYGPLEINVLDRNQPPSPEHWFGTDALGRDVFSRVVHGARVSVSTSIATILIVALVGTAVGLLAGYLGGWVDAAVMRFVDLLLAFPSLLLAIAVAAAAGPGILNSMLAIAAVWWPIYARLVRGVALQAKSRPYVEAATALGGTGSYIVRRHILPNTYSVVLVRMTLDLGYVVLLLAGLGFIGLGERPPFPEWGAMLNEGRLRVLSYWWPAVFPGAALSILIIGFSFLGDGLVDRLNVARARR